MPLALLLMLLLGATAHDVKLQITAGDDAPSDLGIFWEGKFDAERGKMVDGDRDGVRESNWSTDKLIKILEPGDSVTQGTEFDQSFTMRSSDMKFRVRVAPFDQDSDQRDHQHQPYRLFMQNLNHDYVASPLELQHGVDMFIWMERGDKATHRTDPDHDFTFTNSNGVAVATVRLRAWLPEDAAAEEAGEWLPV